MKIIRLKTKKGFTLVEVTITIGTTLVVLALAIFGLLRARVFVNDNGAVRNVEAIAEAEESYIFSTSNAANSLSVLANANPPYLSTALGDGTHQGYNFSIFLGDSNAYYVYAQPERYAITGTKFIVCDRSGLQEFDDYVQAGTYVLASAEGLDSFPEPPTGWTGGSITGGTGDAPPCEDDPDGCGTGGGGTGGGGDTGGDETTTNNTTTTNNSIVSSPAPSPTTNVITVLPSEEDGLNLMRLDSEDPLPGDFDTIDSIIKGGLSEEAY